MLVVRRKAGELIRIGENVELRLLSIGKSSVRLGIEAPRSVAIAIRQPDFEIAGKNAGTSRSDELSEEV
jgi:carbon storage regulator